MSAYLRDPDVTLFNGDALEVLRTLPARSVHMCVTSPPFYGLRDYGTGTWEGGDEACDHLAPPGGGTAATGLMQDGRSEEARQGNAERVVANRREQYRDECRKCGARRIDNQIGLEESPEQWVTRLVEVFREVRRVLRDDGTLWVEIGDSYASNGPGGMDGGTLDAGGKQHVSSRGIPKRRGHCKPKDLLGQPWLLAFALRADGWYLRSEIIWARPNPMPESVTDRPTKAHSTIFMFSKRPRYFWDAEAIREPYREDTSWGAAARTYDGADLVKPRNTFVQFAKPKPVPQTETLDGSDGEAPRGPDGRRATHVKAGENSEQHRDGERWPASGANARSVWTIPTEPTPFAHFATWPQKLVQRMILAGTSERGVCPECGAPWVREVERGEPVLNAWSAKGAGQYDDEVGGMRRTSLAEGSTLKHIVPTETVGWRAPDCKHARDVFCRPVPATVLDPFGGSGTTAIVARKLHRRAILVELNSEYCALAAERLAQQSLFSEVSGA